MFRKLLVGGLLIAALAVGYLFFSDPRGGRPEMDSSAAVQSHGATSEVKADSKPELPSDAIVQPADQASGWTRFRGPNGTGVSDDDQIPTTWSDTENLVWKTELPGFGASSPVLTDDFVFLTSYSGYGTDVRKPGDINNLKRQVICVARKDGGIVWTREFASESAEDPYSGMGVPEHGYATNTAVTDGQRVFAFLGKSGVVAFDLAGNQLWKVSVGTDSGNRRWGTASSLMMVDDLVIVNAAEESQTLYALKAGSGEIAWKSEAPTLEMCYSTPAIARVNQTRDDLVLAVPGEVWGLNPLNGKLTWFVETTLTGNLSPSVIIDQQNAYVFGGYRSKGSLAIDLSGEPEISGDDVLWTAQSTSYVPTPVLVDGRFYWIDDKGTCYCTDAETGERVFRARVPGIKSGGRPVYASPIAIKGKVYAQTRTSGLYVIEPADELKVVAQNQFESDDSVFNATPAVDSGQLFLRSNRCLYCVGSGTE